MRSTTTIGVSLLLLIALPVASSLCFYNPFLGVETCTGWNWGSSSSGSRSPSYDSNQSTGKYSNSGGRPSWNQPSSPPASYPSNVGRPYLRYNPSSPSAPPSNPPSYVSGDQYSETRGCHGNLPFGLENCVCDGAAIGEAAGLAACSALISQCGGDMFLPFSADRELEAVQRACDHMTASSCEITGMQVARMHPMCQRILNGEGKCSPDQALALVDASVSRTCEPLCPDCDIEVSDPDFNPYENESRYGFGTDNQYTQQKYDNSYEVNHVDNKNDYGDGDDNGFPTYMDTPDQGRWARGPYRGDDNSYSPPADSYKKGGDKSGGYRGEDAYGQQEGYSGSPAYDEGNNSPGGSYGGESERGCVGNLPFGLEQCVCDGATIGEVAGLAGCSAVFAECAELMPFSAGTSPEDVAVNRACDSLSASSCTSAAPQVAAQNDACRDLMQQGSSKCSSGQMEALFKRTVESICEPLCPDCPRREQY